MLGIFRGRGAGNIPPGGLVELDHEENCARLVALDVSESGKQRIYLVTLDPRRSFDRP
jgi:hypothetical protein